MNGKHLSMTIHQLFLVTALLIPSAADSGASIWAYVPAGRDAQFLGGIHIPELLSERIVEDLVRTEVVGRSAGNVFSFDIAAPANRCVESSERSNSVEPAVPSGALWPDANDTITAKSRDDRDGPYGVVTRNPWEIRAAATSPVGTSSISCGGIIVGGIGGSIAFLNGRIARRGDTIGKFEVLSVLPLGVILVRDGLFFVIPRGRRVLLRFAGD